jgi:diguanylate cyclase (GGDEF)-like protein/PAS domain S-box-containing protein
MDAFTHTRLEAALARVVELEMLEREHVAVVEDLRLHQEELRSQNEELRQIQGDLAETRHRFQDLFDFAPVAYFVVDPVGSIQEANHSAVELLGLERRRLIGHLLPSHAQDAGQRGVLLSFLDRLARGESMTPIEIALRRRNGGVVRVEIYGSWGGDANHHIRLSVVDVSYRAALEEERRRADEQRRLAASVFEESNEGILITDAQNRILRVNRAFTLVTGYSEKEAVGKSPSLLSSGRHDAAFYQRMWQTLKERDHWQGEVWNKRKSGEAYAEWLGISTIRDAQGQLQYYIAIFSDITEKKQNQLRIEHFAHFDTLTDLPNRVLFNDRLKSALVRANRNKGHLALLFLDLDGFKSINDSLGHQTGDVLLQRVADRLRRTVRGSDTVSRLGGDEFTVILADIESHAQAVEVAGAIAQKIIEALSRPYQIADQEIHSSASLGIAIYPSDGETVSDLFKHADTAMYHAKAAGHNTLAFFRQDMRQAAMRRLTVDNRLRRAVERNALKIVYQPIVDSQHNRLLGLESLLRWQDEELGHVSPTEFVKALEDLGMIDGVTDWLMDGVCRQIKQWEGVGLSEFYVSVNLSPRSFRRQECAELIQAPLKAHGIAEGRVAVEITETHMMQDPVQAMGILEAIRSGGIRVGMDDFGTGYSSLSLLKRFPIDFIKIDGSFVRDLVDDPGDATLVQAIIAMGNSLGLGLVAEGVETHAHVAALRDMGCSVMQGYHYARPMPGDALQGWYETWMKSVSVM